MTLIEAVTDAGFRSQPSIFYGEHGVERGITLPILTSGDWSVDAALSERWAGAGVERSLGAVGLFAGYGVDLVDKDGESRVGLTMRF